MDADSPTNWPFLDLNIIDQQQQQQQQQQQRPSSSIETGTSKSDQQLLPWDTAHLEAWTTINFQFEDQQQHDNSNHIHHHHPKTDSTHQSPSSSSSPSSVSTTTIKEKNSNHHHNPLIPLLETSLNDPLSFELDRPLTAHQILPISSDQFIIDSYHKNNNNHLTRTAAGENNQLLVSKTQKPFHTLDDQPKSSESPIAHTQPGNQPADDDEQANRIAHEEDKRRRNTLASARFRMKKKIKEQEIEREAREMKEKVAELEKQVDSLKQENKWLRSLIVDSTASKLVTAQQVQEPLDFSPHDTSGSPTMAKRPRPILGPSATHEHIHVSTSYHKKARLS